MESNIARLYYECHVTIAPVFGDQLELVEGIAKQHGFKVAKLLMQKRKEDTPNRSKYDTFMTGHAKEYNDIFNRMSGIIHTLKDAGHEVYRYKIEDTLFDSKHGDKLN